MISIQARHTVFSTETTVVSWHMTPLLGSNQTGKPVVSQGGSFFFFPQLNASLNECKLSRSYFLLSSVISLVLRSFQKLLLFLFKFLLKTLIFLWCHNKIGKIVHCYAKFAIFNAIASFFLQFSICPMCCFPS